MSTDRRVKREIQRLVDAWSSEARTFAHTTEMMPDETTVRQFTVKSGLVPTPTNLHRSYLHLEDMVATGRAEKRLGKINGNRAAIYRIKGDAEA
jgi:hypothetical protein